MALFNRRKINASEKSDDALREHEEKYRAFLDNASDAILIADTNGNILEANKKAEDLFGYTRKELLKSNISKIHPADNLDQIKKYFLKIKQGKSEKAPDVAVLKKDGTIVFVDIAASVIEYSGKKALQGIFRDITERKIMEDNLRKSEEKYRTILASMQEGYFEVDLAGNLTFANKAMCKNLGFTEKELIGMNFTQYTSEETANELYKIYNKIFKTGEQVKTAVFEFIRKDKTKLSAETSASLISDEHGKPIGFRGVSRDVTERKQMEDALRLSEEKYRTILENMEDGYFELDLAGSYVFANETEARMSGYSKQELIGINYRKYADEANIKKVFQAFRDLYKTGKPIKAMEIGVIVKDGSQRINEISASLIHDAKGRPIGFRGITHDITDRRKAEELLRKSEEKYRTIIEGIQEGYIELDLAGNFTFINEAQCQILGYGKEELMGMNYRQYTSKETAAKLFRAFNEVFRTGIPVNVLDFEINRKDGAKKHAEISVSLIRDAQGEPFGFRGISRDVTERKEAEVQREFALQALRESEEKYRTILEEIEEGYFELDLAGNATFFNDSICHIFGYPREEYLGVNYKQYTDEENQKKCFQIYSTIYKTGQPGKIYDYDIIRKDGTKRYLESSISLQKNSAGKIIGFRGISRDITERKLAEEALRTAHEKLLKKNKEIEESRKNVQLTLEELEAAYKELKTSQAKILQQEKMASIGQLAAGVAHEINNPVAFISSNLGTLDKYIRRLTDFIGTQAQAIKQLKAESLINILEEKREELKIDYTIADAQKLLQESLDGTDRVQKIVQSLNRFSRVDDADYRKTDINECIDQSINIVWNELKYKGTLYRDYGIISPTKCYPQQLSQVFINLLLNAAQAISEKGEIKIKTREKNKEIWISISDTGTGISDDDKEKIFEPFFTTKEVGKGTGLGLSISYEIIQGHKGDISFESRQEQGTTFIVRLPVVL